jgi:hypothetical protein
MSSGLTTQAQRQPAMKLTIETTADTGCSLQRMVRRSLSHAELSREQGCVSAPHLSISQPHVLQVQPPHIAWRNDLGRRKACAREWQRGQVTTRRLMPHFQERRRVSRTIRNSPRASNATSATATTTRAMMMRGCMTPPNMDSAKRRFGLVRVGLA